MLFKFLDMRSKTKQHLLYFIADYDNFSCLACEEKRNKLHVQI